MKAKLEITGGIIRLWDDGHDYPEPFDMVVTIIGDENVAILKGLKTENLTQTHKKAIMDCLKQHGFKRAVWYRWKNVDGVMTRKELSVDLT